MVSSIKFRVQVQLVQQVQWTGARPGAKRALLVIVPQFVGLSKGTYVQAGPIRPVQHAAMEKARCCCDTSSYPIAMARA